MNFVTLEDGPWQAIDRTDAPRPHALLSLAQWLDLRERWPAGLPVAVALAETEDVRALSGDVDRLSLVRLHFPKWTDGRAYSQARLLRGRLRFRGALRATGDVVVDMAPLLARTGFDSAVLRRGQSADVARRTLAAFGGHYQGDAVEPRPIFAREAA